MKISYVGTMGVPAKFGGFETLIEEITTRIAKKDNYQLKVYSVDFTKQKGRIWNYKGIKIIKVPNLRIPFIRRFSREMLALIYELFDRSDIIHIHGYSFTLPLWKLLGFNVILSTDGLEWKRESYGFFGKKLVYLLYKLSARFSDLLTFDAKFVQQYYNENWGRTGPFIAYGVQTLKSENYDIEQLGLKKGDYYLFVGRLVPEKGINSLIKVFNSINLQRKLVVLGKDPLSGSFENYLRSVAKENIVFLDPIFGDGYRSIVENCYAQIRPSKDNSEGINPSLIEAMHYGACIIASRVDQNVEALGDTGLLFTPENFSELKNILLEIDSNSDLVQYIRMKTKERAEHIFTWDNAMKKIENIYEVFYQSIKK